MPVRRIGADAEDRAAAHLLAMGWTLVTRRWKGRRGELDLVALDGQALVIVEVKARRKGVSPEESLTARKINRIRLAAGEYLFQTGLEPEAMRYDVIAIEGEELRHIVDAMTLDVTLAAEMNHGEV